MAKSRVRRIYIRSKRRRGGKKFTLPIAVMAGLASPVGRTIDHGINQGILGQEGAIAELSRIMTGFNPFATPITWETWRMRYGLLPVVAGVGIHKIAGMLGINRAIAQAGIPLIRI